MENNFYQFTARSLQGKDISMVSFKEKVVLVVNTASKCGLTPQYEGLEKLHQKYKDQGLVILGFPCNQFGNQEPGTEKEISEGCLINYGVSFQMFSKIDVNGDNAHPLYLYLRSIDMSFLGPVPIGWNFTKFLVSRDGKVVKKFGPKETPESIEAQIREQLKN